MPQAALSGDSRYILDVDGVVTSQNPAANTSNVYYRGFVIKSSGTGIWSFGEPPTRLDTSFSGNSVGSFANFAFDFRGLAAGGYRMFIEGNVTVPHDANGYGVWQFNMSINLAGAGSAYAATGLRYPPRIAKRPSPAGTPVVSNVLPTTMTVSWANSGDNAGSTIDYYLLRRWLGTAATGPYTDVVVYGTTVNVAGLVPGTDYTFAVYAHNGSADNGGYSNMSGVRTVKTLAPVRINIAGVWKYAVPYINVGGVWVLGLPYVNVGGVWKPAA